MKSCTDVNQSEKLAEILPVESADMMWDDWSLIDEGWKLSVGYYPEIEKDYGRKCYPAWSLAALLERVLPLEAEIHKQTDGHKMYYYVEAYIPPKGKRKAKYLSTARHENLVDACVEMIFALKKRNLL